MRDTERARKGIAVAEVSDSHRGGAGSPVVLLHGILCSWRVWSPVLPALEERHEVFAPTIAGHRGGPPIPAGPAGTGPLADEMEARLDAAGIKRAHLVGNSLGGWLALELAARGRATSVVGLAPAGCWTRPRDLTRLGLLLKAMRTAGLNARAQRAVAKPSVRRNLLRLTMTRGDLIPADQVAGLVEDLAFCTLLDGLLASVRFTGPVTRLDIDVPVRIAWPVRDRVIPFASYGRPWRKVVPKAEFVPLRGVGHVPMYDDPGLVARTVLEFAARVEADA